VLVIPHPTTMRRLPSIAATLVVVVTLTFAIGIWLVASRSIHRDAPSAGGAIRARHGAGPGVPRARSVETTTVPARQLRAFSILRAPPETPPLNDRLAMEKTVEGRGFGLMFELAHRVPTLLGEYTWIVPGDGYICIMANRPIVAGCNTTLETIQRGMAVVAIHPPLPHHSAKRYVLYGIAPDGVHTVVVKPEHGRRAIARVLNNVYSYRASTMLYTTLVR
jgi:hypothetical protein